MSLLDDLLAAQQRAAALRPAVGGFPHFAASLRRSGVRRTTWTVPAMSCLWETDAGSAVTQAPPLVDGLAEVAAWDEGRVVAAIRADQRGETTFPEFMAGAWAAGCVVFVVELDACTVTYRGAVGETYVERYPEVALTPS